MSQHISVVMHAVSETLVVRNGMLEERAQTASDRFQQKQDQRDEENMWEDFHDCPKEVQDIISMFDMDSDEELQECCRKLRLAGYEVDEQFGEIVSISQR